MIIITEHMTLYYQTPNYSYIGYCQDPLEWNLDVTVRTLRTHTTTNLRDESRPFVIIGTWMSV